MLNEEAWDDVTHTSSGFGLIEVLGFTITENGKIKKVKINEEEIPTLTSSNNGLDFMCVMI